MNIEKRPPASFRQIERPAATEYSAASSIYIGLVSAEKSVLEQLKANGEEIASLFLSLTPEKLFYRYAEDKWTLKDRHTLLGFDQESFTRYAEADDRGISNILDEYTAVRSATLAMYQGFPAAALNRMGSTNEFKISVRALLYHITGHEINHLRTIREKYLPNENIRPVFNGS